MSLGKAIIIIALTISVILLSFAFSPTIVDIARSQLPGKREFDFGYTMEEFLLSGFWVLYFIIVAVLLRILIHLKLKWNLFKTYMFLAIQFIVYSFASILGYYLLLWKVSSIMARFPPPGGIAHLPVEGFIKRVLIYGVISQIPFIVFVLAKKRNDFEGSKQS